MDMTQKSQRDRLMNRELPFVTQAITLEDPTAAIRALNRAERVLQIAEQSGDAADIKRTKAARNRAQKKVDACYEVLTIRALRPKAYDELIDEHPPTPEQHAAAPEPHLAPQWNRDTFRPALLAACVDGDMTEDDWVAWLEEHSARGEGQRLFVAAIAVNENERLPESVMLPKGSLRTPS